MLQNKKNITPKNDQDSPSRIYQNKAIFKKYRIIQKISEGTFGKIYSVINGQNKYFIMKTECNDSKLALLEKEAYNLLAIKGFGIPKLISFGKANNYTILIEQYLGKSLSDLFLYYYDKLTIQDKCLIAIQLIERIEFLHSKTLIHRDIKPNNFLLGLEDPNIIYLTEFRFCSKYKSSKTGKHLKPGFKGTFTGTLRFSSANAQRGMQQSRRDDLESIGYIILLCFKRKLPWDLGESVDWTLSEKDIYLKTYKMKKFIPCDKLCKGCPNELEEYFKYVRGLKFEEEPDYQKLRNIFIDIIKNNDKTIGNNININNLAFSWGKQLNENLRSISKKKNGIKWRIYHNFMEKFENKRLKENTLENINIEKKEKIPNIINKKSTEFKSNFSLHPITQENHSINNNLTQMNSNNISSGGKNLNDNVLFENDNRIKNQKVTNIKNNHLTNRENNQNNKNMRNPNNNKQNLISKERNNTYVNNGNNSKINNYKKINNTKLANNIKRNINKNNTINTQRKKLNLNMNNTNLNVTNQKKSPSNRIINNSQNIRPISNNLNNKIIRRQINLNNYNQVNLTSANLEKKYKPISLGNKNGIYQQNINYNKIYKNTNSNQMNPQNNHLLNKNQTYSNNKNYNYNNHN